MPKKKPDPPREYKVGDRILVNLHRGRIEEATITAIIENTNGKKLQVGIFANQNIVCLLRDAATADFLRREFGIPS